MQHYLELLGANAVGGNVQVYDQGGEAPVHAVHREGAAEQAAAPGAVAAQHQVDGHATVREHLFSI